MMKNQCESCKKLVKMANIVENTCPVCGKPFRLEVAAPAEIAEAVVPVEATVVTPAEIAPTENNNTELVTPGKRGVTNFQMIPVVKTAVDENDIEKLKLLKQNFPAVFESTTKYIGKDRKNKLITLGLAM